MLLPLAGLALVICWFLAFQKTYEAIRLNAELKREVQQKDDLSFNPIHLRKKDESLSKLLKSYRVDAAGWSNELWMKASTAGVKDQVAVEYTLAVPTVEPDTASLASTETLHCYGRFLQLVKLVDTLEHIDGIGRLSALDIKGPADRAETERSKQCAMKLEFKGLTALQSAEIIK